MWVFGCAWKINFPEIIFSWSGVLKALTWKWFEVKIFTSNHFRTHAQREREREREREPSTSTSPITAFDFDFDFDFADLRTHRSTNRSCLQLRWSTNSQIDLQPRAFDPWTFDFAGNPEPSRHELIFDPEPSTESHEPTNRSLSVCDFDWPTNPRAFDLWFFCCCYGGVGGGVLVVFLLCGCGFCVSGGGK